MIELFIYCKNNSYNVDYISRIIILCDKSGLDTKLFTTKIFISYLIKIRQRVDKLDKNDRAKIDLAYYEIFSTSKEIATKLYNEYCMKKLKVW